MKENVSGCFFLNTVYMYVVYLTHTWPQPNLIKTHCSEKTRIMYMRKCKNFDELFFYRAMLRRARYCYGKSSVRLFLRLSVTLRHRSRGLNSSKITSRLVSLGCSLFADPTTWIYSKGNSGEHPEILTGIGVWSRKNGFRRTKALISLKPGKIGSIGPIEDQ